MSGMRIGGIAETLHFLIRTHSIQWNGQFQRKNRFHSVQPIHTLLRINLFISKVVDCRISSSLNLIKFGVKCSGDWRNRDFDRCVCARECMCVTIWINSFFRLHHQLKSIKSVAHNFDAVEYVWYYTKSEYHTHTHTHFVFRSHFCAHRICVCRFPLRTFVSMFSHSEHFVYVKWVYVFVCVPYGVYTLVPPSWVSPSLSLSLDVKCNDFYWK